MVDQSFFIETKICHPILKQEYQCLKLKYQTNLCFLQYQNSLKFVPEMDS